MPGNGMSDKMPGRRDRPVQLTCFGDSICHGHGVNRDESWVFLVREVLQQHFPGLQVRNAGVNGETAEDGLDRLYDVLAPTPPDILYVQFGLNDAWMWHSSEADYLDAMQDIVEKSRGRGVRRILVGTNHPVCPLPGDIPMDDGFRAMVQRFNEALREQIGRWGNHVALVDIEKLCSGSGQDPASLVQEDGVHLSVAGNRLYADILLPVFEACIRRLD